MFGLGFQEIIIILIIALLVIGPRKLPDLAKSLGKAFREFKSATEDLKQNFDLETLTREEPPPIPKKSAPDDAQDPKPDTKEIA
jgi:sec-independent protein translocase protein TatB